MTPTTPPDARATSLDLRSLFGVVWRRKWTILLVVVVTAASAAFFSYRRTAVYSATTEVQVTPLTASQVLNTNQYVSYVNMANEVRVAQSAPVTAIAAQTLGGKVNPDALSITVPTDTQILQITYEDPRPAVARDGAEAFATAYLTYRTTVAVDTYTRARAAIQTQIDELTTQLDEATTRLDVALDGSTDQIIAQNDVDQLSSQIAGLNAQVASLTAPGITPGSIIQPAELPESPSSPNHRQDIALGLVAGLIVAGSFVFLRERLDDQIHSRTDLEEAVGAPVLAIVPRVEGWRKKKDDTKLVTTSAPGSPAAEAYRTLRTNLQFIAREDHVLVAAVTSPHASEGKSTTVANIAVTLAHAGKRVVAISADLRKPRLHRFFGLDNEIGLSLVLAGRSSLPEAARKVDGLDSLRVVTSGPIPPNPAELLSSDTMEEILAQLRESADFIVLDTAPVLVVSDAMIVAPRTDGVILVASADETTRTAAAHAREQLEQVGANILGSVLNGFDASRARYYAGYGRYSYHYRYEHGPEQTAENGGRLSEGSAAKDSWG